MISLHGSLTSKVDHFDPRFLSLVDASGKIAAKDSDLWGPAAKDEASIRLNWVDSSTSSRVLLPELDALAARFRTFT